MRSVVKLNREGEETGIWFSAKQITDGTLEAWAGNSNVYVQVWRNQVEGRLRRIIRWLRNKIAGYTLTKTQLMNRKNLETLAAGLLGEIEPITSTKGVRFDMTIIEEIYNRDRITCGSVGCAMGWAPFFGLSILEEEIRVGQIDWVLYWERMTGLSTDAKESSWCFSADWAKVDNTRQGAGLRIRYMLEHGLPKNWEAQMNGDAQLCYLEPEQPKVLIKYVKSNIVIEEPVLN